MAGADDRDEESGEKPAASLPHHKNYITAAGYQRLRDELQQLILSERPRMVEVVSWAASNGDRSENGDYIYGKKRLREIDRRIRFLGKRIDSAEVVDIQRHAGTEQVFFGATVTLLDEEERQHCYTIVGVDETNLERNHISWISPLARALMKKSIGDAVRFHTPAGWREMEVLDVVYEVFE